MLVGHHLGWVETKTVSKGVLFEFELRNACYLVGAPCLVGGIEMIGHGIVINDSDYIDHLTLPMFMHARLRR